MSDIRTETIEYREGDDLFEGFVAWDAAHGRKRPGVLIAHDWAGLLEPSRTRAVRLAEMGYVGFAIDAYGKGKRGTPGADNSELMNPLLADRAKLLRRLLAASQTLRGHHATDASRIGAVGYCFGGLGVLDMARANAAGLLGVVSFHGIYSTPDLRDQKPIDAKILICHGWEDPLAPPSAALGLAKELTAAQADWQLHAYGHVMHAFSSIGANAPEMGVKYDAAADKRSFAAMEYFLAEVLG